MESTRMCVVSTMMSAAHLINRTTLTKVIVATAASGRGVDRCWICNIEILITLNRSHQEFNKTYSNALVPEYNCNDSYLR